MATNCFMSGFDMTTLTRPKLQNLEIFSCLPASLAFIVTKSHDTTCPGIAFLVNHVIVTCIDRCLFQAGWLAVSPPYYTQRSLLFLDLEVR